MPDILSVEDDAKSPDVMLAFYRRLFPYKPFFQWLNQEHVPSKLFTHREFAFTLGESTYVRYNSFSGAEDFKREILRCNPTRFEVGPVYNYRPRDRKSLPTNALRPEQRELVFDIDMTDYDSIRTCCSGGSICRRCWGFISIAVRVLDHALREQFGFRHLLWVYSGRRGIHCWVSDKVAMGLTDDQRKSLVSFLEVIKGGKDQLKKVNVREGKDGGEVHPAITDALEASKSAFVSLILQDQDCFREEIGYETLLSLLPPDKDMISRLRTKWQKGDVSSYDKWLSVMKEGASFPEDSIPSKKFKAAVADIILQYTYPRIDAEVSKRRNHLLKSPFVIHPGTGRVCVPVDPNDVENFDPEKVPTVGKLLRELDRPVADKKEAGEDVDMDAEGGGENGSKRQVPDYERTSLAPYVAMFEKHVTAVMRDNREYKKAKGGLTLEF